MLPRLALLALLAASAHGLSSTVADVTGSVWQSPSPRLTVRERDRERGGMGARPLRGDGGGRGVSGGGGKAHAS